jgi:DNA-binding NarL/FixJ family response regulator
MRKPDMTTTAWITPLPPTLQRVAQHLVDGLTPPDIAIKMGLTISTVRQYICDIRTNLGCPPRCTAPVLVHCLFTAKEAKRPTTDKPTPDLSPGQQLLLQAVAEHSKPRDIALAVKIAPADVRSALDELLDRTGAADVTQLIVLAHAWGLLGTRPPGTVQSGASR